MELVEQIYSGFQWAEPLEDKQLAVTRDGTKLEITGRFPQYAEKDSPCDLISRFEDFSKQLAMGHQRNGALSPEIAFANADTDEKLIAFVQSYGPVVAESLKDTRIIPDPELGEPRLPSLLIASQDWQELRDEQSIYRAALSLVMELGSEKFNHESAQAHIKTISARLDAWPRQWDREKLLSGVEPNWGLSTQSLNRIRNPSQTPDPKMQRLTVRIVICELLNSFRPVVFPNPLELHNSIKFGIRPLLYSLLRRQFLFPRGFSICPNTECRRFFNIERAGQLFCSPECSLRHRQRIYWQQKGKVRRKERAKKNRKKIRTAPAAAPINK